MSKKINTGKQVLPIQLLFNIKATQPILYKALIVNKLNVLSGSRDPSYTAQHLVNDLEHNNVLTNQLCLFKLLADTPIHQN